jgi:Leucine-rich repeat (LRR) protein
MTHGMTVVTARSRMEGLWSLESLERLNLSGNRIERIPREVAALRKLAVLRLARYGRARTHQRSRSCNCHD